MMNAAVLVLVKTKSDAWVNYKRQQTVQNINKTKNKITTQWQEKEYWNKEISTSNQVKASKCKVEWTQRFKCVLLNKSSKLNK